ncbi:MAG TPA: Rrf2 family transcriptional regulator [Acidobacteriaceae bacterium]|jgi:Rrf2 family protein
MNSRFSTAVHILTLLAATPDERVTSEFLASSIGTNPVVIRRQLALLREAGLVESKGAKGGGWLLGRKPSAIRLSEIREALGEEAALRMHRNDPHPDCPVGDNVRAALEQVYCDANSAINQRLRRWTLQNMLEEANHLTATQAKKR